MSAIIDLLVPDPRFAPAAAVLVLDFLLKGVAILGLAAIAVVLLRRSPAATREMAWRLGLAGVVLVPLLGAFLPEWRIVVPTLAPEPPAATYVTGETGPTLPEQPLHGAAAAGDEHRAATADHRESAIRMTLAAEAAAPGPRATLAWSALAIWLAGVLALLVPLLRGLTRVSGRLRTLPRIVDPSWLALRDHCMARLGIQRAVALLRHDSEELPMAWRGRPWGPASVILPASAQHWSAERREMVLLHEMAHIARQDCLAQLLGRCVRALSWPNPLSWIALSGLRGEAEQACDARVLAAGHRGSDYADHLLDIARGKARPALAPAVAMAGCSSLAQRLQAILCTSGIPRPVKPLTLALAILILLGSVVPLAMLRRDFRVRAAVSLGAERLIDSPDEILDRGLAYLCGLQLPSGAWSGDVGYKFNIGYKVSAEGKPHVGVTALGLLALVEAGHWPGQGARGAAAAKAAAYLAGRVDPETGYIRDHGSRMKSHGFALLALCRYQAKVGDAALAPKIAAAVRLSVHSQNDTGGWRYTPEAPDADLHCTVCQYLALEAAAAAGFPVPPASLRRARGYVGRCRVSESHVRAGSEFGRFKYQATQRSRRTCGTAAAGLAAYLSDPAFDRDSAARALAALVAELPALEEKQRGHYVLWHALYYASEAGLRAARADPERFGERWHALRAHLRELLSTTQEADGGWPCTAGPGKAFSTAMACILLSRND